MLRRLTAISLAYFALASCTSNTDQAGPSTAAAGGYPVELANCGETVTVKEKPERIVSLNQSSTEILLSLGLADRMVGTGTWTDPVLPSLEAENAKVPRLADNYPSFEAVLGKEPDLVTASFTNTLAQGGVAPRDRFMKLGVPTYLTPTECEGKRATGGDGTRDTPLTLDLVYREVAELARLTDVPAAGEKLIADLKAKVTAAESGAKAKNVSAMFWFANSESPYLAGCCGSPGIIANALGLKNVFDDTHDEWPQINWEVVAQRNPTVIFVGDLTRKSETAETAAAKIAYLESNPVTREMDAVKNKRYIAITGAAMNPSIRTVYGIEDAAAGLRRLGLAG
ncbi:ABC transporter substrate-binding protein [Tsukamurella pulmonis]|uniref:ABC transporter substrate-binding protein n=1 Tax=Tsukamurella pulmonis TaxID=47312 RepID=UPI001EDF08EC|nr:ABC transporter substrate-binding protein [Tsukamurella pulmonis]BDD80327.1 ABC transporter substrate-binding protein [Tsukamurella pulmonis]